MADLDDRPESGVFLAKPVIPEPFLGGWMARNNGPVVLLDVSTGELLVEPSGSLGGLTPDHDPRNRPIEPVDCGQVDAIGMTRVEVASKKSFEARPFAGPSLRQES